MVLFHTTNVGLFHTTNLVCSSVHCNHCLQLPWWKVIYMLFVVYFANFAGTGIMVGLIIATQVFVGNEQYVIFSTEKKVCDFIWPAALEQLLDHTRVL